MMRSALLRKLGFKVISPKFYSKLKIRFTDADEMKNFIEAVETATTTDVKDRQWLLNEDKSTATAEFSSVIVEEQSSEYFDLYWGFAPNPNDSEQKSYLEQVSKYRAFRSLIVPYTLVDLPESINRFSTKAASIQSDSLVLTFPTAPSFYATSIDDIQWVLRRLAKLSLQDINEIVYEAQFPKAEFEELVTAKLIYRINNLLTLAHLNELVTLENPSLDISKGLVKNGKVTVERVDGDLGRFFTLVGKTSILSEVIARANEKLNILKASDAAIENQKDLQNDFIDFVQNNPGVPWQKPVQAWSGFTGGFGINASRNVGTGTYFGSTATLQLIDSVSVSGNLGIFSVLDGVEKLTPVASANVAYIRNYSHIRPLNNMKDAKNERWANLAIPRFMNNLTKILEGKDNLTIKKGDKDVSVNPLDKFLSELRVGEIFTITDSLVGSASAQLVTSFDMLMGLSPFDFTNSLALGVHGSLVTLRQTAIHRTADGVQVFVRSQKGIMIGGQFDANYFINILKVRAQTESQNLKTDAFVIDYDPEKTGNSNTNSSAADDRSEIQENLRTSLRALFKSNDNELLYSKFDDRRFHLEHELDTNTFTAKFLLWKANHFNEEHLLRMQFPVPKGHPELIPKDQEVTLFSNTNGMLTGRDILGAVLDNFDGLINLLGLKGTIARSSDPNPANVPFGYASWRTVRTEADLSENIEQKPSVARLQHVWGGWSLSKNKFFDLIDKLEKEFGRVDNSNIRLIEKENFQTVSKIDFYRVLQIFRFYQKA